jgi:membrane-bound lytic murein transglycosylase A
MRRLVLVLCTLAIAACTPQQVAPPAPAPAKAEPPVAVSYRAAAWQDLPGWPGEQVAASWSAWLQSCTQLRARAEWKPLCDEAATIDARNASAQRAFFERRFAPWRIETNTGKNTAFVTGYHDVLLKGSRKPRPGSAPIHGVPDDLLALDLGGLYPELKNQRVRGRLQGKRVVPYWDRRDIDAGKAHLDNRVLVWADDPLDAFFLQVQGSGRVQLEDGSFLRLGYADQNGHPYRSIGRWLVDRGEFTLEQSSMQRIRAWADAHPERRAELLESNPSYVFFKVLPQSAGAVGALGVALTGGSSIAIDPRFIPLGAPVYLATTRPDTQTPVQRLVHAQDTGGAIRGPLRADLFWGDSREAAELAGVMKQDGSLWLLWPAGMTPAVPQ